MFWWKKQPHAAAVATDPNNLDADVLSASGAPQDDILSLGAVLRQNHIAYVPAREWSGVPGTGTSNLVYAPDFLLSAPAFFGGNAMLRKPNSIMIANPPAMITHPKTTVEGIGGVVAGQIVHQPLLEVNVDNGKSEVGE